jgi:hypothetical protein
VAALAGSSNRSFADYQTELDAYNRAYQLYQAGAQVYWNSIAEKRVIRNTKRSNHEEVALSDYILTEFRGKRARALSGLGQRGLTNNRLSRLQAI